MILPNGHFCLIRDKFVNDDGHLVLIVEHWLSEADYKSRPDRPRATHDHLWFPVDKDTAKRCPVDPASDFNTRSARTLEAAIPPIGEGNHAIQKHRRELANDPCGWLSHPHVQALEVTPQ